MARGNSSTSAPQAGEFVATSIVESRSTLCHAKFHLHHRWSHADFEPQGHILRPQQTALHMNAAKPELHGTPADDPDAGTANLRGNALRMLEDLTTRILAYAVDPINCPMTTPESSPCRIIQRGYRLSHKYMEAGRMWRLVSTNQFAVWVFKSGSPIPLVRCWHVCP